MKLTPFVLLLCLLAMASCQKNKRSEIPQISFIRLFPDSVKAGFSEDTAYLGFRFADGDADLGSAGVFLIDSRNNQTLAFAFPDISGEIIDAKRGVEGNCLIALDAARLIPRDSLHKITGDTVQYEVYIVDQAGHESNRFTTTPLYITP